jgi:hypothetical protein
MTEKEVAGAAADKICQFLSAHMSPAIVPDALIVAGVAELVTTFGRTGTATMMRRLADSTEASKPPAVH